MRKISLRRTGIVLVLLVPGMLIMLNAAYGQRRGGGGAPVIIRPGVPQPPRPFVPPTPPPPIFVQQPQQQPIWVTVWRCSVCNAELARGGGPPAIAKCPSCGAFLSNQAPIQAQVQNPVQNPPAGPVQVESEASASVFLIAAIALSVLLVAGGATFIIVMRMSRPRFDVANFKRLAMVEFESVLIRHGFTLESAKLAKSSCDILYGNGDRYVWISAATDAKKNQLPYFNVFLGEGERNRAARDINAVPLAQMRAVIEGDDSRGKYVLRDQKQMRKVLERANDDLAGFEGGFLSGRTDTFHEARKLLTFGKEPGRVQTSEVLKTSEVLSPELKEAVVEKRGPMLNQ